MTEDIGVEAVIPYSIAGVLSIRNNKSFTKLSGFSAVSKLFTD